MADTSPDLEALSAKATPGPWQFSERPNDDVVVSGATGGAVFVVDPPSDGVPDPDGVYLIALDEAFRSGRLVPADRLREALLTAQRDHAIECTGLGEVSCRCRNPEAHGADGWMSWPAGPARLRPVRGGRP